jgi:tetratricopeptide (TPR) repeat protein
LENANYRQAGNYLKEAAEKAPDNTTKRDITIQIAETYLNMSNFQQARRYARQASELDSSWGQPFIQIASIYAGTISNCSRSRTIDRDDRRVYWLVLDYLDRARSVDSSLSNEVQRLYKSYEPVLPSDEDKFFRGWEAGDQITIDGSQYECYSWINETTTVR